MTSPSFDGTPLTQELSAGRELDALVAEKVMGWRFFRMLSAREIGSAMAFPGTYTVLGTSGEQIKQYGNAVTPPAMQMLIKRVVQSITGERAA